MYQGGCDKRTDTLGHAKTDTLSQDYSMIPMVLSQKWPLGHKDSPKFFFHHLKRVIYMSLRL
jgi:hypothetical protein